LHRSLLNPPDDEPARDRQRHHDRNPEAGQDVDIVTHRNVSTAPSSPEAASTAPPRAASLEGSGGCRAGAVREATIKPSDPFACRSCAIFSRAPSCSRRNDSNCATFGPGRAKEARRNLPPLLGSCSTREQLDTKKPQLPPKRAGAFFVAAR